jgi:cytochrome c oxidase subunit 2
VSRKFLVLFLLFFTFFIGEYVLADGSPRCWQFGFQEPATPVAEMVNSFHNFVLIFVFSISIFVFILMGVTIWKFHEKRNPTPSNTTHNHIIEIMWTFIPVVILVIIGFPSVKLIQFMDKVDEPELTLKVVGSQWYWNYEIPEIGVSFESRIIPSEDIGYNQIRLLEVDEPLLLPINTKIRVLVTSSDVLHSWAIPSFAFKKDGCPGRISESWIDIQKEGVYYGQCSEICGMDHGFMPIKIYAVSKKKFLEWAEVTEGDPNVMDFVSSLTVNSISFDNR